MKLKRRMMNLFLEQLSHLPLKSMSTPRQRSLERVQKRLLQEDLLLLSLPTTRRIPHQLISRPLHKWNPRPRPMEILSPSSPFPLRPLPREPNPWQKLPQQAQQEDLPLPSPRMQKQIPHQLMSRPHKRTPLQREIRSPSFPSPLIPLPKGRNPSQTLLPQALQEVTPRQKPWEQVQKLLLQEVLRPPSLQTQKPTPHQLTNPLLTRLHPRSQRAILSPSFPSPPIPPPRVPNPSQKQPTKTPNPPT